MSIWKHACFGSLFMISIILSVTLSNRRGESFPKVFSGCLSYVPVLAENCTASDLVADGGCNTMFLKFAWQVWEEPIFLHIQRQWTFTITRCCGYYRYCYSYQKWRSDNQFFACNHYREHNAKKEFYFFPRKILTTARLEWKH